MKKMLSVVVSLCMVLSLCTGALASEVSSSIPDAPTDFGEPLQEVTYYDENGIEITERTYFVPDPSTTFDNKSGRGWYKNEKTHRFAGNDYTTTYAQGYFVWGNGDVSVSSPSGGYDKLTSGWDIATDEVTSGTGRYAGVFNKYAYVTYSFEVMSGGYAYQDLSVTIRVSESGNTI